MSTTLVFEARSGDGRLELTPVAHPHDPDSAERPSWQAKLTDLGLEAELVCPESPSEEQTLAEYFTGLYEHHQGWDGERSWQSDLESLTLTADHDQINTVHMRIELCSGQPPWRAVVTLPLDPGLFHRIGANAQLFGDASLNAS